MKKLFTLTVIALASSAFAQSIVTKYDGQVLVNSPVSTHEVSIGYNSGTVESPLGYEVLLVSDSVRGGASNRQATGFEITGLLATPRFKDLKPEFKLGYGQKSFAGGVDVSYWNLGVDGKVSLGQKTDFVLGYEHRIGVNMGDLFRSNQISAGLGYSFARKWNVEGRYAHTVGDGFVANGLTGAVSYKF